jgi:hypothetical protein
MYYVWVYKLVTVLRVECLDFNWLILFLHYEAKYVITRH